MISLTLYDMIQFIHLVMNLDRDPDILRKDIGVVGPELLYVMKMSLRRWVGGWFKKASKHPYVI